MKTEVFDEQTNQWIESLPVSGQKVRKVFKGHVVSVHTHYEKPEDVKAREWRDSELTRTDVFVPLTDHPQHAAYLAYRQALRDWPSTTDFPDTRPTL